MPDSDVFIIGGGPAGLATALAARQRGLRVTVADGNRPPIDKACGEGLMPDSVAAARRIGITLPEEEGFGFRGICFHGEDCQVSAEFPSGAGAAFRRTVLHRHLVRLAERAGVELLWSTAVTGIERDAVWAGGRRISARWIAGADGMASRVRRWAGLDRFRRNSRRFAYRQHFGVTPWTDFVEIHWGDRCQIYVTPVSHNEVCLAFIAHSPDVRLTEGLRGFPRLQARLEGAAPAGDERGGVTATAQLTSVIAGNVALIGDASGSVDAITGEGLCQAFQQAEALAEAWAAGDLTHYAARHRQIARRPTLMADLMLSLVRWPGLRRRAFSALAAQPQCFARMLAGHVGELSGVRMAGAGLAVGWRMMLDSTPGSARY